GLFPKDISLIQIRDLSFRNFSRYRMRCMMDSQRTEVTLNGPSESIDAFFEIVCNHNGLDDLNPWSGGTASSERKPRQSPKTRAVDSDRPRRRANGNKRRRARRTQTGPTRDRRCCRRPEGRDGRPTRREGLCGRGFAGARSVASYSRRSPRRGRQFPGKGGRGVNHYRRVGGHNSWGWNLARDYRDRLWA